MGRWTVCLLVLLVGCASHAGAVRRRAAEQLGCDESDIEVERMHGGAYRARGCGADLTYVCGGPGGWGAPTCVREASLGGDSAGVDRHTATPPPSPSSWSDAQIREYIAVVRGPLMACFPAGHPGVDVQVRISERGAIIHSAILDRTADDAQRRCAIVALHGGHLDGVVAAPRMVRIHIAPVAESTAAADAPAEVPSGSASLVDPEAWIRSRIDARREHVLTCVDAASVALVATWDAAGAVTVALRGDRAGTPEERCIQATLGTLRLDVAPGAAGSLVHPVVRE